MSFRPLLVPTLLAVGLGLAASRVPPGAGDPRPVTAQAPIITAFHPGHGPAGTAVTLTGAHLAGTTSVAFGGVASQQVTVSSDTSVTAVVPNGAETGPIQVSTPAGTAASGVFTVIAQH